MSDGESRKPLPVAVLISGTGRTLKNINDRVAARKLDVDVRLVIASTSKATGIQFAAEADAPSCSWECTVGTSCRPESLRPSSSGGSPSPTST